MSAPRSDAGLLDLEQLRAVAQLGGEDSYLRRLYDGFADDARRTLARMREYAVCGEAVSLAREAHRLKGGSGSIGAVGFSRGCQEIERRARQLGTLDVKGPIAEAHLLLDEAQRLLDATLAELRAGG